MRANQANRRPGRASGFWFSGHPGARLALLFLVATVLAAFLVQPLASRVWIALHTSLANPSSGGDSAPAPPWWLTAAALCLYSLLIVSIWILGGAPRRLLRLLRRAEPATSGPPPAHRAHAGDADANSTNALIALERDLHGLRLKISSLEQQLASLDVARTRELETLAFQDSLTHLFNRRHLDRVLEQKLAESRRYGEALSCVMMDVDDFKSVNDRRGHRAGDRVLQALAETIRKQLRSSDIAARYGGDEFALLLPHTNSEQARILVERIRADFIVRMATLDPGADVTLSIGVASTAGGRLEVAEALLGEADQAMYQAKSSGKNRTIVTLETDSGKRN